MSITHFTSEISTVEKILKNGFAWVPNKRNLIQTFIKEHDFLEREPQEFGMISFTEQEPAHAKNHREVFGQYGIVMADRWVSENKLQKVIYVDEQGPIHEALTELFKIGYYDLKEKIPHPEDGVFNMSYTNKAMSSIVPGATCWYNLLQLYEYMEPMCNSYQQEWRLVNKDPLYGFKDTKKEIIENVSPPVGWASVVHVYPFEPIDVAGFACPIGEEEKLYDVLPNEYKSHSIAAFMA